MKNQNTSRIDLMSLAQKTLTDDQIKHITTIASHIIIIMVHNELGFGNLLQQLL